jgi:hypothetical protein
MSRGYAISRIKESGSYKMYQMHRMIMGCKTNDKKIVDHKNHDTLDNTRENLRFATRSQNMYNLITNHGKSQYKGVSWHKQNDNWIAHIKLNKVEHIGSYDNELEAAQAYNKKAIEYFGEYAYINKI